MLLQIIFSFFFTLTTASSQIEIILVVDAKAYTEKFKATTENSAAADSAIKLIFQQLQNAYHELGSDVVLLHVEYFYEKDPYEIKVIGDDEVSADELLTEFNDWRKSQIEFSKNKGDTRSRAFQKHDAAHLISGYDFSGDTIGLAYTKSICSNAAAAGINQYTSSNQATATTLSHELGHNLGLLHDTDSCNCEAGESRCIMAAASSGQATQWSSCSFENFGKIADMPCINDDPDPDIIWTDPICGDGIVSGDEQCDCGQNKNSTNLTCNENCCDKQTCKLKPVATCDQGGCCDDNCQIRELAYVCRSAANECDLPEVCNGYHAMCPIDVYRRAFEPCFSNSSSGYCSEGLCQNQQSQCQNNFGPGARFDSACYESVDNPCDELICTGTYDQRIATQIEEVSGSCFKFKQKNDFRPPKLNDGTPCTTASIVKGICTSHRCVAWQDPAEVNSCPGSFDNGFLECNGKGVCNSETHCHCDCGYAPPFCVDRGEGGSVDSGTPCPTSFNMLLILLLVLLLVVVPIVLFIIMRWYLKRNNYPPTFSGFLDAFGIINNKHQFQDDPRNVGSTRPPERPPPLTNIRNDGPVPAESPGSLRNFQNDPWGDAFNQPQPTLPRRDYPTLPPRDY